MVEFALLMAMPFAVTLGAVWDLFTYTIPNRISVALVALFFATSVAVGMPTGDISFHVAVGLAALTVGFVLFTFGSFGGGDAKLLAASALWMGPAHIAPFLVVVGLAGGLLAVVILAYRQRPIPAFLLGQTWAMALHERRAGIPYGIAIAAAMLVVLPSTHWFGYLI